MRVAIVGDFTGRPDEGMKNVAIYLADALEEHGIQIHRANIKQVTTLDFYQQLRSFNPDIIHYIPGITWRSLLLGAILRSISGSTLAMSAIHVPNPDRLQIIRQAGTIYRQFLKPDLVFTHGSGQENDEKSACNSFILPNGVDLTKYKPLSESERIEQGNRWEIREDDFVVLHVGHLKSNRNLRSLIPLQQADCEVIIVASEYLEKSDSIKEDLQSAGCRIITGYVDDIETLYACADCYAFPVEAKETIGMPLSILEAMACNLPVVTMNHPGIRAQFETGHGLHIVDSSQELKKRVNEVREGKTIVDTRSKVKNHSWNSIAKQAINAYEEIHE